MLAIRPLLSGSYGSCVWGELLLCFFAEAKKQCQIGGRWTPGGGLPGTGRTCPRPG
ncbi:hypothetical protein ACIBL8_39005 [Streptomyces sp. NPDC050523]|uniref:hypothetical protein n=1 Tax=Streptomyces sp. NPDC050523 TaxID=3365622 RepID=UPI0037B851ED